MKYKIQPEITIHLNAVATSNAEIIMTEARKATNNEEITILTETHKATNTLEIIRLKILEEITTVNQHAIIRLRLHDHTRQATMAEAVQVVADPIVEVQIAAAAVDLVAAEDAVK